MYFCPGAPVMHSRDLVHWRTVSYIYDFLEDDDVYNLRVGRNAYGSGQWATSLRYHRGVFYALFVANDQHKSYLYRTRDIVNGPWERTVFEDWFFHDPSLLFDDGRLWVVWGNGELRLVELEPDGSAVKGEPVTIISAPKEGWGLRAEGAHFYHIGDYYYVIEIDWPKGGIRQATCWRSRNREGPYESKVVLKGTLDGRERDGVAQGPIVDTQFGDWYALQFQDHGAVGLIPTIQRVTWEDGWPMMGKGGVPEKEVTVNLPPCGEDYVYASDSFDSPSLQLAWQWNHKAPDDWSCRGGSLFLKAHPANGIADARGTLTQRVPGPRSSSVAALEGAFLGVGDEAGICAFQSHSARLGIKRFADRTLHIQLRFNEMTVYSARLRDSGAYLKVDYDFDTDTAVFSYSENGRRWTRIPYRLKMKYTLDYFTGYRSALYCFGAGGGTAQFLSYRISNL